MTMPPRSLSRTQIDQFHALLLDWYANNARDLPWRGDASPWAIMVSEFMLQQTPVARVLPVFAEWMQRWPAPADLAAEPTGVAVRAWGRLGYPRRALRLHAAATTIVADHNGQVPADHDALLALAGVGAYTAAAIASFAYGQPHVVLDTNVRRVFARVYEGIAQPASSITAAERQIASTLMPVNPTASSWAAATMELGAIVCTSRAPRCVECPVATLCRWRAASYPAHDGPKRPTQKWDGTDRQCRGCILQALRDADGPLDKSSIDLAWPEDDQRERALDGLMADGLVELLPHSQFALPG